MLHTPVKEWKIRLLLRASWCPPFLFNFALWAVRPNAVESLELTARLMSTRGEEQ
jgi:hypothetical protein